YRAPKSELRRQFDIYCRPDCQVRRLSSGGRLYAADCKDIPAEETSSVRRLLRLKWPVFNPGPGAAMATNLLSGGQLVVAALRAHQVDMAFSVAGESYLE